MRSGIAGLGLASLVALAGCDQPTAPAAANDAPAPAPAAAPALSGPHPEIRAAVNPSLSAAEAKNLETAVGKIAADGKISHAIADGPVVFLHYAGARDGKPAVMLHMLQFDEAGAVTAEDIVGHLGASADLAMAGGRGSGSADAATEAANKATVTKFYESISDTNKRTQLGETVADTYVEHSVAPPVEPGAAGLIKTIGATPQTLTVKAIGAWGDLVAADITVATSDGAAGWNYGPGGDIFRLEGGKVVERWRVNY